MVIVRSAILLHCEKWFPLIPDLKPVYVLFYLGVNDAGFRDGPNAGYDVRKIEGESKIRSSLREKSALYDLFRRLRDVFSSISNTSIYAGHSIRPSVSDYTETHTSQEIEKMVRQNTDLFKVRMQSLVEKAKELGAQPICVSQPHLFVMGHGGISKGIAKVFEYENSFFNGLDYQASISALNDSMKHICVQAGGYYIDIASKEFAASDFYDVVHMSPGGAEKLGEYLFEEFEKQGIAERLK